MHKWVIICAYSPIINHSKYLICVLHSPPPYIQGCSSKLQRYRSKLWEFLQQSQYQCSSQALKEAEQCLEKLMSQKQRDQDMTRTVSKGFKLFSPALCNSTTGSFLQTPVCGTARNSMSALEIVTGRINWHELLM